jgi:hypothetical protein
LLQATIKGSLAGSFRPKRCGEQAFYLPISVDFSSFGNHSPWSIAAKSLCGTRLNFALLHAMVILNCKTPNFAPDGGDSLDKSWAGSNIVAAKLIDFATPHQFLPSDI